MSDDDYDFDMDYHPSDSPVGSNNSDEKRYFEELLQYQFEQYSPGQLLDEPDRYLDELLEGDIVEAERWYKAEQEEIQQQVELFAWEDRRAEQVYQRQLERHLEEIREQERLAEQHYYEYNDKQNQLYELAELAEEEHQWTLDSYMEELALRDEEAAEEHANMVELQAEHDRRVEQEYQRQLEQHLERQRERQGEEQRDRDMLAALEYDQVLRNLEEQTEEEFQALAQQYSEQEEGAEQYLRAQERQARLDNCSPPPPSSDPMRPDSTCVICFNKLANTVLIPCGHLLACSVPNPPLPGPWRFVTDLARIAAICSA